MPSELGGIHIQIHIFTGRDPGIDEIFSLSAAFAYLSPTFGFLVIGELNDMRQPSIELCTIFSLCLKHVGLP